ncbi:MAG: hypothetical protein M3Y91_09025 [Actinomycetota bacterium]|nr:hypothetical protein [Actinomycetota bacterium]
MPDGTYAGDFTLSTRPTGAEVVSLINLVGAEVAGEVGDVPALLTDNAAYVVALGAASLVEVSYFPEQVRAQQSAYPDLDARYIDALGRLQVNVAEGGAGESVTPQWSFPSPALFTPVPPPGVDPNSGPQTTFLTEY